MAQNNMSDMLQSLLSALNNEGGEENVSSAEYGTSDSASGASGDFSSFFENIDFDMLMKAGEVFSRYNSPDKNTELLRALKPHLREENKDKIDTAIKIVKITALLPFLRESGLFDKMF
ncbi:MAG: hypothetical protein LBC86_09225 [Oscillospiraceae bacterium]|jgi:hypothetical protein|nr:hypothetical protein [Oscillospiraceae bacterium]